QAEDGIRYFHVTGVQTCALPIWGSNNVLIVLLSMIALQQEAAMWVAKVAKSALEHATVLKKRQALYANLEAFATRIMNELRASEIGRASCRERGGDVLGG